MFANLIEIIKRASNPPTDVDTSFLRECLRELRNPLDVNLTDSEGKTPCHHAANNFPMLVILALEGGARLPDNLTEDLTLKSWINELRNEQIRNKKYYGFHLHDLILKSAKEQLIKNRCRVHQGEINQKSYWKRNACHWAAMMNRADYLVILVQLGGDLSAEDLDRKKPLDFADQATIELFNMKMQELTRASISASINETGDDDKNEEQPEGFFLRVKSGLEEISVGMMRAMSPPRTMSRASADTDIGDRKAMSPPRTMSRARADTDTGDRRAVSPSRNPAAYERHQRALSANLSPRDKGAKDAEKTERATSPKSYGILKRILSADVQEKAALPVRSSRCRSLSEGFINIVEPNSNTVTKKSNGTKAVGFLNMPPSIELAAIDPIEPGSPESPSSPLAKDKSIPPPEKIISIIKEHSLKAFKKYFKKRRHSPNHKIPGFGRPYIIEAFLSDAENIFLFLLQQGASLNVRTTTGRTFIHYIFEDKTVHRIGFLKNILYQHLTPEVRIGKVNSDQESLNKLEKEFMQLLEEKGLFKEIKGKSKALQNEQLIELSEKHKQPLELVTLLYDLCLGLPKEGEVGPVNLFSIQKHVVGLLINKSRILVAILNDFYPHFKSQQKLITILIVKEIILWDRFHKCYRSKTFCDEIFAHFLKLIDIDGLDDLSQMLKNILELQHKIDHPMLRVISQLENIITACDSTKPSLTLQDHKLFANELIAMTSGAFHTLKITELMNKAWEKKEKLITAPTVTHLATIFNKISDYVLHSILTQPSEDEIISAIKFYVKVMNELIHGEPCDLHSAMAISSALSKNFINRYMEIFTTARSSARSKNFISRYMEIFLESSSPVVKLYQDAQEILEFAGNYKLQREIMANTNRRVFPWIGIFTKDLTFSNEISCMENRAELDGSIFLYILRLQNRERVISAPQSLTNLPYQLQIQKEYTDPDFELISIKSDSKAIRLNYMNLLRLKESFSFYIDHQIPLKVVYAGQKEGVEAVNAVFSWIKENIGNEDMGSLDELDKLFKKMELLQNLNEVVKACHEEFISWLELESSKNPKLAELIRSRIPKNDQVVEEAVEPILMPFKF